MPDFFRIEGLPAVKHTEQTRKILNALNGNKSKSIRKAIRLFADEEGFNWNGEDRPVFLDDKRWQSYLEKQQKSQAKKSNRVDYTYLIAFWYLQDKFSDLPASTILRRAILNF